MFVSSQGEKEQYTGERGGEGLRPRPETIPRNIPEPASPPRDRAGPLPLPKAGVKIAIIIDDIGFKLAPVYELLKIEAPIAFAILPHCPHSLTAAEAIHRAGRDILLHLPMEPQDSQMNPGEGALFRWMSEREISDRLEANLAAVPHVKGVNNHMGSAFMEEEEKVHQVLRELKDRGLFFIDSRTTPKSRAATAAEETGIRFAARNLFLDNDRDRKIILDNLVGYLKKQNGGSRVIIGHPYPATIEALQEAIPLLISRGIQIVPPSQLAGIIARSPKRQN